MTFTYATGQPVPELFRALTSSTNGRKSGVRQI